MGRRSRKRGLTAPPPVPVQPRPAPATPRARMDDAPKAPWSPFPLVELVVLVALVLIVVGFVTDGPRRAALLGCGFALVTLAGLELALREHFTGFRSHSTLLAGAGVFGLVLVLARNAFRKRSGGLGFRA